MSLIDLTDYKISSDALGVHALTRGFQSEFTGYRSYAATVNDYWAGSLVLKEQCHLRALRLRGLLELADGRSGGLLVKTNLPQIEVSSTGVLWSFTDETDFTDGTWFTDVEKNPVTQSVDIISATAGAATNRTDEILIAKVDGITGDNALGRMLATKTDVNDADYQVVRMVAVTSEDASTLRVKIRPRLRADLTEGQTVLYGNPPMKMRFLHDQPVSSVVIRDKMCDPVELQLIEWF